MAIDPEMRQRLLELVYGLSTDEEAAQLRSRIEAEPELAEALAEAEQTSQLFGEAAGLQSPKIPFGRPGKTEQSAAKPDRPKPAVKETHASSRPWARGANWTVALAAGILLVISIGGFLYHRGRLAEIAADHLRLRVTGPAELQAGVENRYLVTTASVAGNPISATVQLALFTPEGTQLISRVEKTDEEGDLEVTIPAELEVPDGSRLEIEAEDQHRRQRLDTRLTVLPVRHATQLSLDKPLYQPGETVRYRSLTLNRFELSADRQVPIHFEILDPSGTVVGGSELEGVSDRGVGCGQFEIPPSQPGGEYTLVARSLDESFPEERRSFFIRAYRLPRLKKELEFTRDSYAPGGTVVADFAADRAEGGPAAAARLRVVATVDDETVYEADAEASADGTFQVEFTLPEEIDRGDGQLVVVVDDGGTRETIAKTIPINLGKVDVEFFPEGGDLVSGMKNRVYFRARDLLGDPVHIVGVVVDAADNPVALVETEHEGMGVFGIQPRSGEKYRLRIDEPAGVTVEPRLPVVSIRRNVVLNTGLGVVEAGAPLEFNVRSNQTGLPLVAAASSRGVPVGQEAFVTGNGSTGANAVAIDLSPAASGVIRLTIFDYSTSPPEPVAERLVYRRCEKKLNVRVSGHSERYSPGEEVKMSLMVTDENGSPTAAALGVAVVDDALLSLADDDTPSIPTHFLLTTEVENPQDLEDADFYLLDEPSDPEESNEAVAALDLLLGTQGWRRFVEKTVDQLEAEDRDDEEIARLVALGGEANPPAMFDNLTELDAKYKESLSRYRDHRTRALNVLTTLSLFGGLALLLTVAMLAVLNVTSGVKVWGPALVAATVCLFIGVVLMNPGRPGAAMQVAVAYAPFDMEPPEPVVEESSSFADDASGAEEFDMFRAGMVVEEGMPIGAAAPMDAPVDALGALMEDPAAAPMGEMEFKAELGLADEIMFDREPLGRLNAEAAPVGDARGELVGRQMLGKAMERRAGGRFGNLQRGGLAWRKDAMGDDYEEFRFAVREYSHSHVPGEPGVRSDFAETLFWHPLLIADANGRAEVSFELSDSVTTFRVSADAHGDGGRIGSGSGEVISRIPFNLEPKLPLEVTAGDRIDLPLAVVNDTLDSLPVEIALVHGDLVALDGRPVRTLQLDAEERARAYFTLDVVGQKGDCELTFHGTAGWLSDAVRRPLSIVPPGFPVSLSYSGEIKGEQEVVVRLPEDWAPGSLEVSLNVFPSTLSDLQKGMDSILREPCGCFEQASTSNYPNVLSLQYMQEHDVANPEITRRARDLLDQGYAKLTGYESPEKGYEWFGGNPGHEALTAYGLMEFTDMAEVYDVDAEMLNRTADWLLARRDGSGGFERNPRALDSFGGAPEDVTNAYITWALASAGQAGLEAEIEHVGRLAEKSDDPYVVALAASSLLAADKQAEGRKLLKKLSAAQADDGHLEGTNGSITRSGGHSLKVETTALAAMAWMKDKSFAKQANRAVEWIVAARQGSGGFGSTQATILALKAMIEHTKANTRVVNDGKLIVRREDDLVSEQAFAAGSQETIALEGLEARLVSGDNRLAISLTGDNEMPYALDVTYRSSKPASDDACPVRLTTELAKEVVAQGDTVALTAKLTNTSDQGQPMTVAIIGLPAGLEVRPDQLDELKEDGTIDYYETRAREVICYWRSLAPEKEITLKLDLIAAVPGSYTGPASRAYLYYTAEQKQWNDPLAIEITRD